MSYFLAVRLAGFLAASLGLLVLSRWTSPPVWVARALDVSLLVVPSVTVGLLCAWLGGITSPYTAGLGFILSCRAPLMSERWPVATAHLLSAIVAFVATLLAISLYSDELGRQLRDQTALVSATVSVSISVSVAVFAVIGGHTVWALRRVAFEGKDLGRVRLEAKIGGIGTSAGCPTSSGTRISRGKRLVCASLNSDRSLRSSALAHAETARHLVNAPIQSTVAAI